LRTQAHRALSPRELSVFLLHALASLPYDATAEAQAVSVPARRTAWASATKKLRRSCRGI
jgi:DNA-directed RNA polymerase specialized sigma24 family protein